jgi:hypothetical protein
VPTSVREQKAGRTGGQDGKVGGGQACMLPICSPAVWQLKQQERYCGHWALTAPAALPLRRQLCGLTRRWTSFSTEMS